jgi:hypothetical protein
MKAPKIEKGRHIKSHGAPQSNVIDTLDYPVFCFRHLQGKYDFYACQAKHDHIIGFVNQLYNLSKLMWNEIQLAPKHGIDSEKISRDAIKPAIPQIATHDVTFLALRYHGKNPMIGFRNGTVFHILWIDHDFSVYNHG